MGLKKFISDFCDKYIFNVKWRCAVCEKEIFDGGYFCEECKAALPFNEGAICNHCGRRLNEPAEYCSTCKEFILSPDVLRSVFVYEKPVSSLIMKLKYGGKKYIADVFAEYLANVYFKFGFDADFAVFVPMTARAERKRGFNQSKLLADKFSALTGVPLCDCVSKIKETDRQATLGREKRMTNLSGVYKITDAGSVKGKSIVIIDDVSTTGATAESLSHKLKKAGATKVCVLTVASVPPAHGY